MKAFCWNAQPFFCQYEVGYVVMYYCVQGAFRWMGSNGIIYNGFLADSKQ